MVDLVKRLRFGYLQIDNANADALEAANEIERLRSAPDYSVDVTTSTTDAELIVLALLAVWKRDRDSTDYMELAQEIEHFMERRQHQKNGAATHPAYGGAK